VAQYQVKGLVILNRGTIARRICRAAAEKKQILAYSWLWNYKS
jgi:hypothetical protein